MTTHFHFHPHAHLPIRWFTVEHPYAGDWLLLIIGSLAALVLWFWNN